MHTTTSTPSTYLFAESQDSEGSRPELKTKVEDDVSKGPGADFVSSAVRVPFEGVGSDRSAKPFDFVTEVVVS
jgi:hypothetical protein